MSLEEYIIKKQDARIDFLERRLGEVSESLEKLRQEFCHVDDVYVDMAWFEKVLAKLHPEIREDNWYEDI